MAKVVRGTTTVVSTGNKMTGLSDVTIVPEYIVMSVTTNNGGERSVGGSNGVIQYSGNSGAFTDSSASKSICHYRDVSGVKTKTIEGTITGFSTGIINWNFTTLTENTSISFTVYGS